jgi:hypothetical protein
MRITYSPILTVYSIFNVMNDRDILRGQSGEGMLSGFYVMFVMAIIIFLAVEVACYGMSAWKLYGACAEIMDMMKSENGLDSAMELRFRELVKTLRLDDMDLKLSGTPQKAQRGDILELRASGRYRIRSLRPLGRDLSISIGFRLHGLAHTYVRRI